MSTNLAWIETDSKTTTPLSNVRSRLIREVAPSLGVYSQEQNPAWYRVVKEQIESIRDLRTGWDGYYASSVRGDVIFFALQLLSDVMKPSTPAPFVVPMSHEGLMLEWHRGEIDLEIEIEAPGDVWISYRNPAANMDVTWPVRTDFSSLAQPIDELSAR